MQIGYMRHCNGYFQPVIKHGGPLGLHVYNNWCGFVEVTFSDGDREWFYYGYNGGDRFWRLATAQEVKNLKSKEENKP